MAKQYLFQSVQQPVLPVLGVGRPTTPPGVMNMLTESWLGYECTYYA